MKEDIVKKKKVISDKELDEQIKKRLKQEKNLENFRGHEMSFSKTIIIAVVLVSVIVVGVLYFLNSNNSYNEKDNLDYSILKNGTKISYGLGNLCGVNSENENCYNFCNENREECKEYCKDYPSNEFCNEYFSKEHFSQELIVPIYQKKVEFDQDLVISSGERNFSNTHLIFKGNVIVNGTGKLVISNAHMDFRQEHNFHYSLYGKDNAQIELDNVYVSTNDKWMVFDYRGNSNVKINNFFSKDPNIPWQGTGDSAVLELINSRIGITPLSNVTLRASNSNLFLELGFISANGTFKLPLGHVDEFRIDVHNNEGDKLTVDVKNSTFRAWGTTLFSKSNITFVDTKITIGIDAGADWSIWPGPLKPHVKVSNLRAKTYNDFILNYDTNILRLINTEVTSWYPQAFREAIVEISNSDLADVNSNGQNAHLIIRNSTAEIAIARENVTYEFYDSMIEGDVTVEDNGKIHLYNTKVGGIITQKDNGKVYIEGMPFQ